ncbi:MAG: hypothetical protein ABL933_19310 [Methyloglobulus sp.]|nr:hypothetical protein [Methyloglobulus sp.]
MKIVDVKVTWLASKAVALPHCHQYITVAKFQEDKEFWEKEAWSIVLEFNTSPAKQGNPCLGTARFLVENAPVERLIRGKKFEMHEGKTKVAEIEII